MKNNTFHILFSCSEEFHDIAIKKTLEGLKTSGLDIQIEKRPIVPYASLEWAIPSAIFAYIAKPYFESFLKEAGKDHYNVLKKWLRKTAIRCRLIKVTTLTASKSTQKKIESNTQSKAFSLYIETVDNKRIKFLFDDSLDDTIWEKCIDKIVESTLDNYNNFPNDEISLKMSELNTDSKSTFYAIIDKDTKDWLFLDNKRLIEIAKKNSSKG